MKKLLLLSSFLSCVSAFNALAVECTSVPSCTSLGYSKILSASCDGGTFIKCPFDANYGICIKIPSEDDDVNDGQSAPTTWPLADCKAGDYLNVPAGSTAYCSATDLSNQNYRVIETDNTYIYYAPAGIMNVQPVPTGSFISLSQILSSIGTAHPGCKIIPFNEIIKDVSTYLGTVGANLEFVAPNGPSDTVIVLVNGGYNQAATFSSGYSQVYACANMFKKTDSSSMSLPAANWASASATNSGAETKTCPDRYKYRCDAGYINTSTDYCMNEGSTVKWYTTACTEECAGYTYQCTNNQFNKGESCTKTSDGGSVWYKTACQSISCSQYGSGSWYGSAVNCKNYCNSVGAYYSYVGLANDGVTSCYKNSGQNGGKAGPCIYCETVYNLGTGSSSSSSSTSSASK